MRALILIPLVALAACSGENQGWNPNYRAEATPYGNYLREREAALTGYRAEPPRTIPVARPFKAPTPAEIAGPSPVQELERAVPAGRARKEPLRGAPAVDPVPPSLYPRGTVVRVRPAVVTGTVRQRPTAPAPAVRTTPVKVTTRPLGSTVKPLYARSVTPGDKCAAYPSQAAAQRDFADKGGPQRDPLGLDPDGDGRACSLSGGPGEPL